MMKKILSCTALILSLFLLSCESQRIISVTCVNALTGEPLDSVLVNVNAGLDGDYTKSTASGYTDSAGHFETTIMIGCPGKCYDIYVSYTKTGFEFAKNLNELEGEIKLSPLAE
ncbi:MAG: hypothetical protein IPM74_08145 [Crocinitomicaceae bacterium]|nr:hypothetical protein [Crocinitomicaceae bacterium]MBK8925868.1 hypothetical protein [Crocinitomicaceae bacterium]